MHGSLQCGGESVNAKSVRSPVNRHPRGNPVPKRPSQKSLRVLQPRTDGLTLFLHKRFCESSRDSLSGDSILRALQGQQHALLGIEVLGPDAIDLLDHRTAAGLRRGFGGDADAELKFVAVEFVDTAADDFLVTLARDDVQLLRRLRGINRVRNFLLLAIRDDLKLVAGEYHLRGWQGGGSFVHD